MKKRRKGGAPISSAMDLAKTGPQQPHVGNFFGGRPKEAVELAGARAGKPNSVRAMEHAYDLIRPWRRATIAVTVVAAVELIVIAAISIALFGNPLANRLNEVAAAGTPRKRTVEPAPTKRAVLERSEVSVMVLNGNGVAGAAHEAAERVRAREYLIGNVGNASAPSRRSVVMYRPGYEAEGARLARDLRVRIVRPLDGLRPAQLMGSHLVLILGR